ncbi:hypothetical protein CIHG_05987 [Coccidioides immitis H538.4]|uniref:Uncharacterized protein n=1 Tax=Coccidioides immitis H538.4 TaxID=396776 RepID=A0A0J8RU91_COCIT|nr:hypothetical protein CIHG_05987 [Coccidioides immitis H538.4]
MEPSDSRRELLDRELEFDPDEQTAHNHSFQEDASGLDKTGGGDTSGSGMDGRVGIRRRPSRLPAAQLRVATCLDLFAATGIMPADSPGRARCNGEIGWRASAKLKMGTHLAILPFFCPPAAFDGSGASYMQLLRRKRLWTGNPV